LVIGLAGSVDLCEGVGWLELGCSSGTGCSGDEGAGDGEQDSRENGGRADVGGEVNGGGRSAAQPILLGEDGRQFGGDGVHEGGSCEADSDALTLT
jgi:hypothetical protein